MPIKTLAELFLVVAERDRPVLLQHKVDGTYQSISTQEFADGVRRLSKALLDAGIEQGDRVALMAENGPHWPTIDFATLCIGAVLVPIYPTLTPDQAAYIARDSGAKLVFAQDLERYHGLAAEKGDMPHVEQLILIGDTGGDAEIQTLAALQAAGEGYDAADLEARARAVTGDDLATFIYTSGTTGNPKGVRLSHTNIASNVTNSMDVIAFEDDFVSLSFLPLSHSFERTVDYIYFLKGCVIAYAESVNAVAQNLQEVKPHVFVSVPRVYEKVLARIHENIAQAPALRQKIFHWAVGVGRQALEYRLRGTAPPGLLGFKLALADKLVFSKIRERLGGRFQFAISGGAPLAREVAEFFWGAGVRIYEGYGLSETSPVLSVNRQGRLKLGSVGAAIPGVELRIAEDGEILAKGPNIMQGYHNLPEATAEAIDDDGWFHTGDIGEIDEQGILTITDRKKEIIVNAYGKNVAPAPIENALKASTFINQVMVIGDKRKFLSALIVPDFEALEPWAVKQGVQATSHQELITHGEVQKLFRHEVEAVNDQLARYEQVKAWDLLPGEWTIESGELTPTMKVKRRIVAKNFAEQIDALYERAGG